MEDERNRIIQFLAKNSSYLPLAIAAFGAYSLALSVVYIGSFWIAAGRSEMLDYLTFSDFVDQSVLAAVLLLFFVTFFSVVTLVSYPQILFLRRLFKGWSLPRRFKDLVAILSLFVMGGALIATRLLTKSPAHPVIFILVFPFALYLLAWSSFDASRAVNASALLLCPFVILCALAVAVATNPKCGSAKLVVTSHGTYMARETQHSGRGVAIVPMDRTGTIFVPWSEIHEERETTCPMKLK